MKIVTLIENTCGNNNCIAEHGLSLYVETKKHKLLMDAGQTDAVLKNATVLGIDLESVDTIVLSHGNYDHSGGIMPISRINVTADIYMQKTASEPHYNGEKYIGIDKNILTLPNVKLVEDIFKIDDELFLFSNISGRRCYPQGNKKLSCMKNGILVQDNFSHEQCLVISQNNKKWLLSGCAHNGVLNILDRYRELFGSEPDYMVSGFHMMKADGYDENDRKIIEGTAEELAKLPTLFFTGHCTHHQPYEMMKPILGDKITEICTGFIIEI